MGSRSTGITFSRGLNRSEASVWRPKRPRQSGASQSFIHRGKVSSVALHKQVVTPVELRRQLLTPDEFKRLKSFVGREVIMRVTREDPAEAYLTDWYRGVLSERRSFGCCEMLFRIGDGLTVSTKDIEATISLAKKN